MKNTWLKGLARRAGASAKGRAAPRSRDRGRIYRLTPETLEIRVMLSQVNWINPAGGDWDTPGNWSTDAVPGANDAVNINVPGNVTITHANSDDDAVQSITASDPITLSGGTLSVTGMFSDSSAVTLSGGTLANATVTEDRHRVERWLAGRGRAGQRLVAGTLNLSGFGSAVSIVNNLTLASGLVETTNIGSLYFSGTQTLAGTGEVRFTGTDNHNNEMIVEGSGSVLTIDPNITIDGLTGRIVAVSGTVDNYGTLSAGSSGGAQSPAFAGGTFTIDGAWINEPGAAMRAVNDASLVLNAMGANDEGNTVPAGVWTNDAGATISVTGNSDGGGSLALEGNGWSNAGTIAMTNSSVLLGGTFTLATLGSFTRTGGTVDLTGTLNNTGTTLALNNTTGAWLLDGGTVNGGTISTSGSAVLGTNGGSSTLKGPITLAGTLDENNSGSVTVLSDADGNGLTLAPGLIETTTIADLIFSSTQTLAGTGEVLFDGGNNDNNQMLVQGSASVLTIDPDITIDGLTADINAGSGAIDNFGTLSVGSSAGGQTPAFSGGTFAIDGAWTNEPGATMKAVNDGSLDLNAMGANDNGNIVPTGVWINDAGATISVTGNSDGGGSLGLEGNGWSSAGTIKMTNSTVLLGGTFTLAALGSFGRTGGTVDLTGTLNNTGTTLALDNTTGGWELNGGTINGGTVTTSGNAVLSTSAFGADLNGPITLAGTLDNDSGDAVVIAGGLTLGSGNTTATGLISLTFGSGLSFNGTQVLNGTGELRFADGDDNQIVLSGSGTPLTLTVGSNVTIDGNHGAINSGSGTIVNQGTVSSVLTSDGGITG